MLIAEGTNLNLIKYHDNISLDQTRKKAHSLSLKEQMEAWYKPMTSREDLDNWFADRFDQAMFEVLTQKESHDRPKRTY
jgi:hypothetical protein